MALTNSDSSPNCFLKILPAVSGPIPLPAITKAVIGPKDIEKNSVVFSRRDGVDGKNSISINEVSQKLKDNLDDIQSNLLETSKNFRKDNTIHVDSKAELIDTLNSTPGFVTCYWDENTSDEIEIKDLTKATLRCYLLENGGSAKAVNNESVEGKKAIFSKAY